jgi:hypothetical protein
VSGERTLLDIYWRSFGGGGGGFDPFSLAMNLNALRDEIREDFEGLLAKEEEVLLAISRGLRDASLPPAFKALEVYVFLLSNVVSEFPAAYFVPI